jgi:hypothetical protein
MSPQIATGNCNIGISPLPTIVVALMACGGLVTTQAMTKQKYHYSDNVSWPIDFHIYFQSITRSGLAPSWRYLYSSHYRKFLQELLSYQGTQTFLYVHQNQ